MEPRAWSILAACAAASLLLASCHGHRSGEAMSDFASMEESGDTRRDKKTDSLKAEPRPGTPPPSRPSSPGVKAGSADDNLQFNAFLAFLEANGRLGLAWDVSHRIIVSVSDRGGLPLADAKVSVVDGGSTLLERRTYADGRALVFPSESQALGAQGAGLLVEYAGAKHEALLHEARAHRIEIRMDLDRERFQQVPLDVAFVLDTTGSMGDEIARLKKTIEFVHFQISNLAPRPDVRFGMVLYRDKREDYRTKVVPFTADVAAFRKQLDAVQAGGGGDTPEDVQAGLAAAMNELAWRERGVKLAFLIGDAPPHLDYGQEYTYVRAMRDAAGKGIKFATIGASGLDQKGELVWRQLAQYTLGPFIFLTYGEHGDSEGTPSTVSHHVGANWVAENLDAIVIRLVKVELAHYSEKGAPPQEDYFAAGPSDTVPPDGVLEDLFRQSVRQLTDYCVQKIDVGTPTVVLPVKVADRKLAPAAEKLSSRLALGLAQAREFQLVEKADLPDVLKQLADQYQAKYDGDKVAELGKLVPAKLAVFSRVTPGDAGKVEMMVKLVRLETGEILSLSLLKIAEGLVPAGN
jgi:Mg-chelatase subunit ChlD